MQAFVCTGCGAKLRDPMGASFVTCSYCGLGVSLAPPQASLPPPPPPYYGPPPPPHVHVSQFNPYVTPVAAQGHGRLMLLYVLAPIGVMMMGAIISAIAQSSSYRPPASSPVVTAATVTPPPQAPTPARGDPLGASSSKPVLTTSADAYTNKQSAVIRFRGMPATTHGWVSIAKAGTSAHTYLTYEYVTAASGEVSFPLSSYPPGDYLARAYADSGYTLVAEVAFTIRGTRTNR